MQRKLKTAASVLAFTAVAGLGGWHVLQYRVATKSLIASTTRLAVPTRIELEGAGTTRFLQVVSQFAGSIGAADEVEAQRVQLVANSTWLQRLFTTAPPTAWKAEHDQQLGSLLLGLPELFGRQSAQLSTNMLEAAAAGRPSLRDSAAGFRAYRSALRTSAQEADRVTRQFAPRLLRWEAGREVPPPTALSAVTSDDTGRQIEAFIEGTAQVESRVLRKAQDAMTLATQASQAASGLRQDAPSGEIGAVVSSWTDASRAARAASDDLRSARPRGRFGPLYDGLVSTTRQRTEQVASEIDRNLSTIQVAYQSAVSEEATITGFFSRLGRRTVASAKNFLSSSTGDLQARLYEIQQAATAGLDQAVMASSQVISQGIQAYEESRKPPVQRFVESKEGMGLIIGAVVLLLFVGVILAKGNSTAV